MCQLKGNYPTPYAKNRYITEVALGDETLTISHAQSGEPSPFLEDFCYLNPKYYSFLAWVVLNTDLKKTIRIKTKSVAKEDCETFENDYEQLGVEETPFTDTSARWLQGVLICPGNGTYIDLGAISKFTTENNKPWVFMPCPLAFLTRDNSDVTFLKSLSDLENEQYFRDAHDMLFSEISPNGENSHPYGSWYDKEIFWADAPTRADLRDITPLTLLSLKSRATAEKDVDRKRAMREHMAKIEADNKRILEETKDVVWTCPNTLTEDELKELMQEGVGFESAAGKQTKN